MIALLLLALGAGIVDGQSPEGVLVIDGGTLIDGNGGTPVRDAAARLAQPGIETIDTQRHEFFDEFVSKVAIREGGPTLRLKVTGYNFFDRTQVFVDDRPMPFELKSITEIEVTIDERYLQKPGRYKIQVRNPPPPPNPVWGDGRSNVAWLLVAYEDSLQKPWVAMP